MGDARAYDVWAQTIAAGNVFGSEVFYQAPLYPYFIGAIYALFGRDLVLVRVCQAVLGAGSCVLLGAAAARLFESRLAGITAGLGLAVYAPAIFFDGLIQKSALDVFLVSLVLWLLSGLADPPHEWPARRRWMAIGFAMGALCLARENALILVVVVLAWILTRFALPRRQRWSVAASFVAGLALALGPVAARNSALGQGLYLTTSQFGPNFFIGNNSAADGTYMSLRPGRGAPEYERTDARELAEAATGRALSPSDVSRYWTWRALEFVADQPGRWLWLMGRKFMLLWNAKEVVDTESLEAYAEVSTVLRFGSVFGHFGVLVPLAVLGVWTTWESRRRLALFHVMVLAYAGSVMAFYVFARYRFPLVPMLMLFAAAAVSRVAQRGKSVWATPGPVVLVISASILANWRMLDPHDLAAVTHTNMGIALRAEGRMPEAEASHRHALSISPDNPIAHYNLANVLLAGGRIDEAARHFQVALTSLPGTPEVYSAIGVSLTNGDRLDEAIVYFRRALDLDETSAQAHEGLGYALVGKEKLDDAVRHLRRAVSLDPESFAARYNLGSALLGKHEFGEAAVEFRQALAIWPDSAELHNGLGIALASQGLGGEAAEAFRRALDLNPHFADAARNLELTR